MWASPHRRSAPGHGSHSPGGRTVAATRAHFELQDPELQELVLILHVLDIMFQASFLGFHLFYLQNQATRVSTVSVSLEIRRTPTVPGKRRGQREH